jgi:hypothetical protein
MGSVTPATSAREGAFGCRQIPPQGSVSEEFLNSAQQSGEQPERLPLLSRSSVFLSEILDSFSSLFFCVPFSSLTHLLSSLWSRFLAEE